MNCYRRYSVFNRTTWPSPDYEAEQMGYSTCTQEENKRWRLSPGVHSTLKYVTDQSCFGTLIALRGTFAMGFCFVLFSLAMSVRYIFYTRNVTRQGGIDLIEYSSSIPTGYVGFYPFSRLVNH